MIYDIFFYEEVNMLRKRQKGFTLIELLIVVAIIAIIAAIAIPNLLTALQKGRQKRTMGDMKTIGSALESYNTDYAFYPPGSTVSALKQYLTPFYIQSLPERDGWGTVFAYQTSASSGSTVQDVYSIISYGRNKAPGGGLGNPVFGQTYVCTSISHFDTDIYFSNGQFTWAPKQ
jgi:general secretion pathway protein G